MLEVAALVELEELEELVVLVVLVEVVVLVELVARGEAQKTVNNLFPSNFVCL